MWVDAEMRGGRNSGVGIANARPASNYGSRQSRGQPNSRCSMPVLDSKVPWMLILSTASHGDSYAPVGKRSLTEKYSEAHPVRSLF